MEKKREERVGEWLGMGAEAGVGDASRAAAGEGVGWRRRRRWRVWRARREEERAAAMEAGDRIEIGFAVAGSGVLSETRDLSGRRLGPGRDSWRIFLDFFGRASIGTALLLRSRSSLCIAFCSCPIGTAMHMHCSERAYGRIILALCI